MTGVEELRRNFTRIRRNAFDALERELIEQAQITLSDANNAAPQLTGDMINDSLVTNLSSARKSRISVVIAYTRRYAVLQHERVYNPGPVTSVKLGPERGVGRKWLEKTLARRSQTIIRESGRAVERALRTTLS